MQIAKVDEKTRETIQKSALKFAELAERKFGIRLDFSEESLLIADELLTLFFKFRKKHYYTASVLIGTFLGEVIIENLGGKWLVDYTLKKVGKTKVMVYPIKRAQKRLSRGMEDSLVSFYRSLKLSAMQDSVFAPDREQIQAAHRKLIQNGWDIKLLMRILDEEEPKYVREEAAELLGRLEDRKMLDSLLEALKNSSTAYYAAIALQGIPDPSAFEPLMKIMNKSRSPGARMQAALALGEVGDPRAVNALVDMLSDTDEMMCHYASIALGKIGGDEALEKLLEIMGEQRPGNRVYAIAAIELTGDRRAVPALIEALFSRDEDVREAAVSALQYIPDERAQSPLIFLLKDPSSRIRTLAAYALCSIGKKENLPLIRALLKDEVPSVRQHAAQLVEWLEAGKTPAAKIV
ncbi:MAG: HEAT repeat domain-containing protein [bacterium]